MVVLGTDAHKRSHTVVAGGGLSRDPTLMNRCTSTAHNGTYALPASRSPEAGPGTAPAPITRSER